MAKASSLISRDILLPETVFWRSGLNGPTLEEVEQMPQGELQDMAVRYLLKVLEWLFRIEQWYLPQDLLIRHPEVATEHPIAPDIAVFIGVRRDPDARPLTSWDINPPENPPPTVVFEVASNNTYRSDLDNKPPSYAAIGASEYFAFDPRPESIGIRPPLRGWSNNNGVAEEMEPDEQGRLWSSALGSFVVADGRYLRLQDADGNQRLTGEEAERGAKEAERAAKERAWAKLRALGVEPD